ncbi:MAG: ABC transporter substrate-binding protein [Bacillota bacterium]
MKKKLSVFICLLVLAAAVAGCGKGPGDGRKAAEKPEKPRKITFMLDWVPNTNHTGIYVAREKGYFAQKGLDVEIVQPSQGGATDLVATGKAQFGVSCQEEITMARAAGVPIVSIAAVIQHNTSGFASKSESNIKRPRDFAGKRYGGWGAASEEAVLRAVVQRDGADPNKVKIFNIGTSDFFAAISKDIDFAWIFYGWTGIEAELRGMPLNMIMLKDLDPVLDYYTPVLFTNESVIKNDPQLVRDFLAAASMGYNFAADNPDQAAEILLKQVPELNAELVRKSQKWLSPRYRDDAPRWGEQKKEVWQKYTAWMEQHKLLPGSVDADRAFTNEFLP